jgi:hypothetical protein
MGRHWKRRKTSNTTKFIAAAAGTGALATGGALLNTGTAQAHDWSQVLQCESSGNWSNPDTGGNGHFGGLQFGQPTWEDFGGLEFAPRADLATPAQQIEIAERTLAVQGMQAWETLTNGCASLPDGTTPGVEDPAPAPVVVAEPVVDPVPAPAPDPAPAPAPAPASCVWEWPVDAPVTSPFGDRDGGFHDGTDFGAFDGTEIHAATSGTIDSITGFDNDPGGYGNYIQQTGDDGTVIQYGHVSDIFDFGGAYVHAGDVIGLTGHAGGVDPHLHLRIHDGNGAVDPVAWLQGHGACDTGATDIPAPAPAPEPAPAPAPDPAPAPAPAPEVVVDVAPGEVHVVVEGDTLFDLGAAKGLSWQDVWGMNPQIANPDLIFVGDSVNL